MLKLSVCTITVWSVFSVLDHGDWNYICSANHLMKYVSAMKQVLDSVYNFFVLPLKDTSRLTGRVFKGRNNPRFSAIFSLCFLSELRGKHKSQVKSKEATGGLNITLQLLLRSLCTDNSRQCASLHTHTEGRSLSDERADTPWHTYTYKQAHHHECVIIALYDSDRKPHNVRL